MRYVVARYNSIQREEAYRIYISDTLYHQGRQECLTKRYADIIGLGHEETDERSGNEIAEDIISRMGLKVKG